MARDSGKERSGELEFMRQISTCQLTGDRKGCHDFVLNTFEDFLNVNPVYQQLLPALNSGTEDTEWLEEAIGVVVLLFSVCPEQQMSRG